MIFRVSFLEIDCLYYRNDNNSKEGMRKLKKRILSIISSCLVLCFMVLVVVTDVEASENNNKVDGSFLTMDESSTGTTENALTKGKHMMTGECSITKAGKNRIYAYGSTTGNHVVDYIAVIVYVERYLPEKDAWGQVYAWIEECEDDFVASTAKTLTVENGYYYRVRAEHFAEKAPDPMEETFSFTDGIWI